MQGLSFQVLEVVPDTNAATPLLLFKIRIVNDSPTPIQNIALRCQVQIEATRRRYNPAEQEHLVDLFGEPDRWSRTLGRLLWTHAAAVVGSVEQETTIDLPVPCTFDFNVAATKYFYGLEEGEIPLTLLFSGTVFYADPEGQLRVSQIPWDVEATFRLPVQVWRAMMDRHYPNGAWLRLRRDVFERLQAFKAARGIPTWEEAIEVLLTADAVQVPT